MSRLLSSHSGLVKINPFSEKLSTINIQIQVVNVPTQTVMTKGACCLLPPSPPTVLPGPFHSQTTVSLSADNVQVSIDSVIYYHVKNP